MATMAAWWRRVEAAAPVVAVTQDSPAEQADPYRLRPLPGEDVYFYRKRIDNRRVARAVDPAARRNAWRAIVLTCGAAAALILLMLPEVLVRAAGYQIHALQREHEQLVNQKAMLELEEARLLSPDRLQELASTLELVDPVPGQVMLLNPKPDGSLAALNLPKK